MKTTTLLPFCLLLLLLATCKNATPEPEVEQVLFKDDGTSIHYNSQQKPFYHSVASGDPLPESVIIWTRVTPIYEEEVVVKWQMSTDRSFKETIQSGETITSSAIDYTVKIDVKKLTPATTYYYQFEALGKKSPIGTTKTLANTAIDQVKLAVVSCSNFEAGFFNAFGRIAEKKDIDAVLHLGDYIYEYSLGGYGDTTLGRHNLPIGEILTLSDYRTRYSVYRLDKDFQAAHQNLPFICIWDDHEISNNAYVSGAQNHQADEGDYNTRKAIARQAYYEWLPVRESKLHYRKFQFGQLVDVLMLDERLAGRTVQVDSLTDPSINDASRSMLGDQQLAWFLNNLDYSKATWKIIGNQVIFSDLAFDKIFPNSPRNMDAWDGYPFEKKKIIDHLQKNKISNTIFVTGDTHCSWAFETPTSIADYSKNGSESVVAMEWATTSISSPNYDEKYSRDTVKMLENLYFESNPHLQYIDLSEHGYLLLTLDKNKAKAEWMYVETLKKPSKIERVGKTIEVMVK